MPKKYFLGILIMAVTNQLTNEKNIMDYHIVQYCNDIEGTEL